jgi:hypothetical protein
MGEIVVGLVVAVVLSAAFGFWRRHHQPRARPAGRLVAGLLAAAGGVVLICMVVFTMPTPVAQAWTGIVLIFIRLAVLIAGITLALGGVRLAIASTRMLRTPRE